MYTIWPWLWPDPIGQLQASLSHWTYIPTEYFLGQQQAATPIYYVVYLLVTTPVLLFIPMCAGAYGIARSRNAYSLAIIFWFIVPFAYSFSSFIQDGMRYLLMIYPAMAILISIGLDQIASWVASFNLRLTKRFVYITLAALTIMYLLYALVSVYPYYLDYYNALAGGPSNVQENRLFEFGWWGEGVYDSLLYIEHNAPPGATVYIAAHPSINVQYYNIAKNFTYAPADGTINVSVPSTYDYIITNYFSEIYYNIYFDKSDYTLEHVTTVQGTPMVYVYKRAF
jgi:hypothetical protein